MNTAINALDAGFFYEQLAVSLSGENTTNASRIRHFNRVLLSAVNKIAERERHTFLSYNAKIHFVAQTQNADDKLEKKIYAVQQIVRHIVNNPKFEPTDLYSAFALKTACDLIAIFSEEEVPETLRSFYKAFEMPDLNGKQETTSAHVIFLREEEPLQTNDKGETRRVIRCKSLRSDEILISLLDYKFAVGGKDEYIRYATESLIFRENDDICFSSLSRLEDNLYAVNEDCFMVLSPDHLYDATRISKCFFSRSQFWGGMAFFNRFVPFEGSVHTLRGNIVNTYLDTLVTDIHCDFEKAFERAVLENMTDVVRFTDLGELEMLKRETRKEFEVIRNEISKIDGEKTTEPSFISELQGIQGRLDLIAEPLHDPGRKDIVELKSTRVSGFENYTNRQHDIQAACYNILLRRNYGEKSRLTTSIFYSRDENNPLRNRGGLFLEQKNAVLARNQILDFERSLAERNFDVFSKLIEEGVKFCEDFPFKNEDNDFCRFAKLLVDAGDLRRHYFREFSAFVMRELIMNRVGTTDSSEVKRGFSALWNSSREDKKAAFSLIDGLEPLSFDAEKQLMTFRRTNDDISAFRNNDMVILYPYTEEKCSVFGQQILKGVIKKLTTKEVQVSLMHRHINKFFLEVKEENGKPRFWAIENNHNEKNYDAQLQSLYTFLKVSPEKADLFFGIREPRFDPDFKVNYTDKGINEKQNEILQKALSAKDYFLLQGPPGTGKTSKMLKNMVDFLYRNTNETVVLLAFTNRATDEICEKVFEVCGDNFIRIGNSSDEKWIKQTFRETHSPEEAQKRFKNCRIFVGTVSSYPNYASLIVKKDTVIIDEASQLLEPQLCGILPFFQRFILIGDEKQLPAVVQQNDWEAEVRDEILLNAGFRGLQISLFERLLRNAQSKSWHFAYEMLSYQYRTHEQIASFINAKFYDDRLLPGCDWQKDNEPVFPEGSAPDFLRRNRLIFIESQKEKKEKVNKGEAIAVKTLLMLLRNALGEEFSENSVGVITPFRAQIAEINLLLDDELRQKVTVDTVERFQGSERDFIIISTAVNSRNAAEMLQCLNFEKTVDKKLNVALSRARKSLMLVGNPVFLMCAKFYAELIAEIPCKMKIEDLLKTAGNTAEARKSI
jgi:DNA replication ATP-dependent helicase Dna2